MELILHANATTTPRTRAYIQHSQAPVARLAVELGVSETTVRRWKVRDRVTDGSHTPKRLAISLSPLEEALVAELRTRLHLPLDDIAEVMRRCVNATLSRSAIYRCLKRQGLARRPAPVKPAFGTFEDAPVGFIHMDLKHLPDLRRRKSYVFVAIDRASRFVHIDIVENRNAKTIAACLKRFLAAFPHTVHTILTDNGAEFTDRFAVDKKDKPEGKPSGEHPFDRICRATRIEHRLTKPFHPRTNGMVERFNRRLAEALRQHPPAGTNSGKNRFVSHDERNAFLHRVVDAYNHTRLRCLHYISPIEALHNQAKDNTKAGVQVLEKAGFPLSRERRVGVWSRSSFYHFRL